MADEKISAVAAKATLHDTDLVPIVDIEAAPDETKHITGANIRNAWRKIQDADGDTKVDVEEAGDEDMVRMDVAGVEAFLLSDAGRLTLAQNSSVRVRLTSSQVIPTGTYTVLSLATEEWDVRNEWNNATYRFTAAETGKYLFVGVVQISALADGKSLSAFYKRNGASAGSHVRQISGASGDPSIMCSTILDLAVNDYIEFYIWHDHGSNLTAGAATYRNYLCANKIA